MSTGTIDLGDTDKAMVRMSKDLIERAYLKPLKSAAHAGKDAINRWSIPFEIRGVHFVPNGLVRQVVDVVREQEQVFRGKVEEFMSHYREYVAEARQRLGGNFISEEYPSEAEIREKFDWRIKVMSMSSPDHMEQLDPQLFQQAQADFQREMSEFRQTAMDTLRSRFAETVGHLVNRLTPNADGKRKIFKDATIQNMRDFLTDFEALNLTNDGSLAEQVERVRGLMAGVEPGDLRDNAAFAERLAGQMDEAREAVVGMLTTAKRRIRLPVQEAEQDGASDGEALPW